MSKATYPLKLPTSIKTAAARLAKEDGVSLNQWIATAVAQKVGAVETAAEFFKRRAAGHSLDEVDDILARVPDRPPEPGDELPEELDARFARRPVSSLWAPRAGRLRGPSPAGWAWLFTGGPERAGASRAGGRQSPSW